MSPSYVDASALVKLIVEEPESEALALFLRSAGPPASSILVTVEVARAVTRAAPDLDDRMAQVLDAVSMIEFNARIAARAAAVRPPSLRTLDAIHLASAMELGDELTAFVCYDARLSAAARDLGLPVVSPGEPPVNALSAAPPVDLMRTPAPRLSNGGSAVQVLLDEHRAGR